MELNNGKKSIWLDLKIVVPVMAVAVFVAFLSAVFVTISSPKIYTASAKLQLEKTDEAMQSSNKSARQISTYAEIANDSTFKKLVLEEARSRGNRGFAKFRVSAEVIGDTNILEIDVQTTNPKEAKVLANAAARALVKKSGGLNEAAFKETRQVVKDALKPVDQELADLRGKLFDIRGSVDESDSQELSSSEVDVNTKLFILKSKSLSKRQSMKAKAMEDQIDEKKNLRAYLVNYLSKESIKKLLSARSSLTLIFPAETPGGPSSPSWPKNISIAVLAGLMVGIAIISATDIFGVKLL